MHGEKPQLVSGLSTTLLGVELRGKIGNSDLSIGVPHLPGLHTHKRTRSSFIVSWYTSQYHLKTTMNSARSLNTLDHQREATRDSCRKSNYPSGNTWLFAQLGELPAENTGLGESPPRTLAAALPCYFHFSS